MTQRAWHRIVHPLCGADPLTLARLTSRSGRPTPRGVVPFVVAWATGLARVPFTVAEAGWVALDRAHAAPPVFIVGYPRSGTTHLHNLMAASGRFATVPPVLAALPWEARGLALAARRPRGSPASAWRR